MICPNCKTESDGHVCPKCGTPLMGSIQPSTTKPCASKQASPPKKPPFYKSAWFILLCVFAGLIVIGSVWSAIGTARDKREEAAAAAYADALLDGMVKIPNTFLLPKEHVEATFKAAGLNVEFVVTNFDDRALKGGFYIHAGECDSVDTSQPAVQYFDSDDVGGAYGFYAEVGATIIVGYSDHDFDGTQGISSESGTSVMSDSNPNSITTSPSSKPSTADEYAEINARLQEDLKLYRGWAFGTHDSNGNPTENGDPFPEYAIWAFVYDMTYDGKELAVQVRGEFLTFTEDEKIWLAGAAQSAARIYLEDLKSPFTTIYNGETVYGHSKALDVTDFKWYD